MNLEKLDNKLKQSFAKLKQEISGIKQEQNKIRNLLIQQSKDLRKEVGSTKKEFFNLSKGIGSVYANKEQLSILDKKMEAINTTLNSLEEIRSDILYVKGHYVPSDKIVNIIFDLEELKNSLFEISNNTLPRKEFTDKFSTLLKTIEKFERDLDKREKFKKEIKICRQLKKELIDFKNSSAKKLEVEERFTVFGRELLQLKSDQTKQSKKILSTKDLEKEFLTLQDFEEKMHFTQSRIDDLDESVVYQPMLNKEVKKLNKGMEALSYEFEEVDNMKQHLIDLSENLVTKQQLSKKLDNVKSDILNLRKSLIKFKSYGRVVDDLTDTKRELKKQEIQIVSLKDLEQQFDEIMNKYSDLNSKFNELKRQSLKKKSLQKHIKKLNSALKKFDEQSEKLVLKVKSKSETIEEPKELEVESEKQEESEGKSMNIMYQNIGGEVRAIMVEPVSRDGDQGKVPEVNAELKSVSESFNKKKSVFRRAIDSLNNFLFEEEIQ